MGFYTWNSRSYGTFIFYSGGPRRDFRCEQQSQPRAVPAGDPKQGHSSRHWGVTGDQSRWPTLPALHCRISSVTLSPLICLQPVGSFQHLPRGGGVRGESHVRSAVHSARCWLASSRSFLCLVDRSPSALCALCGERGHPCKRERAAPPSCLPRRVSWELWKAQRL